MKRKKEKDIGSGRPVRPPDEAEMASLELESPLIQSDRVQTPGPGVQYLDNSEPGSEEWTEAYQDFFRRS